jgi:enamine deaminase RidA (YjgF/YER057c/UK114 family)
MRMGEQSRDVSRALWLGAHVQGGEDWRETTLWVIRTSIQQEALSFPPIDSLNLKFCWFNPINSVIEGSSFLYIPYSTPRYCITWSRNDKPFKSLLFLLPIFGYRLSSQEKLTMSRKLISSGSIFESEIGYSRAVVDGDFVFVSGCTG